jgi:RNA polymerase sigma-70 factor (ECF subfamily)
MVRRYQRRVYAVIYRMTGKHSEVDDLCQETFLQVFRSLPRLREGSDVDAWVYRIAMNVSVDYIRRKTKDKAIAGRVRAEGERPAAAEKTLDQEAEAAVRRALDELPPDQKSVVVLRMFENMSHDEIAEVLQTPVATVRWRLFAARQKLEELLKGLL